MPESPLLDFWVAVGMLDHAADHLLDSIDAEDRPFTQADKDAQQVLAECRKRVCKAGSRK